MKKIGSLLIFVVCMLLLTSTALASGKVTYDGSAGDFVLEPGSEESLTDLFDELKRVMPGDTCTQQILIKNDAKKGVKIKLYMKSLGAQEDTEEFLSQMKLRVQEKGDSKLFEAPADQTAQLKDQVWKGNTSYSVNTGSQPFHIDVNCQDGAALSYKSNNPGVASVDAAGNVTVGGVGTATITITSAETKYYKASSISVIVTVNQPAPVYVDPQLQASGVNLTINPVSSGTIGVNTNSPGARSFQIISGGEFISVDGNGNVTAKAAGTAVVRVSVAASGNFNAKAVDVTVNVTDAAVH